MKLNLRLLKKRKTEAALVLGLVAAAAELLFWPLPFFQQALAFFVTAAFPPVIIYFYSEYTRSLRTKEIEENLPPALFQIASFPRRTSMEKIMREIAKSDYGSLSEEFAKANRQIAAGASVPQSLDQMAALNDSVILQRACNLLAETYRTGADMSEAFKEVADDVFELQNLQKQTAAALSLQKYTLLAGGCVLVPLILGIILSIVTALNFDFEGITLSTAAQRASLVETAMLGAQIYLVIFAAIASVFVAMQEANAKKAVLYFILLFPVSLAIFYLLKSMPLF
ncbi:TPA: type II secretion system F family protein [Candidatus Micrarchaeota archaeon]|nr:type II secretion system F family protein [Candidatus Micrarchaeota archaeon]